MTNLPSFAGLLYILPHSRKWFNTSAPIMKEGEMEGFCRDWASAVGTVEHTAKFMKGVLTVSFCMINSPYWHPNIAADTWKLLEHFISDPEDSQPLKRCLENTEVTSAISAGGIETL